MVVVRKGKTMKKMQQLKIFYPTVSFPWGLEDGEGFMKLYTKYGKDWPSSV